MSAAHNVEYKLKYMLGNFNAGFEGRPDVLIKQILNYFKYIKYWLERLSVIGYCAVQCQNIEKALLMMSDCS